ncbi:hypothetical protein ACTFIU_009608 [Dictyostelium citrinum]
MFNLFYIPNLIGIIAHQIWIICHKLLNTNENKPEPKFEKKVIETELLNLIETEKFITLKKIKLDEAILKNTKIFTYTNSTKPVRIYKEGKEFQELSAKNPESYLKNQKII